MAVERFGVGHLSLLAATAVAVALGAAIGRSRNLPLVRCLAYVILAAMLLDPFTRHAHGELTLGKALPLHLCDTAAAVCAAALLTRRQLLFELAYFWGFAGVTQALLTPSPLPPLFDPDTARYFVAHGATLAGVACLLGLGLRPRRGAWARAWLVTAAYAVPVGLIDWILGANYMWLRASPEGSVLSLMGPWPFYLLGAAALAAALFYALERATARAS